MSARAFVAVAVPPAVRDALAGATSPLRRPDAALRATAPAGWHLTLAFLGALDDERLARVPTVVTEVLEQHAPRPAPVLGLGAAGRFSDRVLLAHVHDDPPGSLGRLVAPLRAAFAALDVAVPPEGFRPHVTLARARGRRRVTAADAAALHVPTARWQPTAVGVWVASSVGSGPYEVRAEVPWPGSDAPSAGGSGG